MIGDEVVGFGNPVLLITDGLKSLINKKVPITPVGKMLDVRQDLVRGEHNFGGIGRVLDVIGQGLGDLCIPADCAAVKDTNRRWDCPSLQFVLDRSVNQFSGWLEDEDSLAFPDKFTDPLDYQMGLAGTARGGTIFDDTHGIPIEYAYSCIYP
jgi:hypothetical protein